MLAVAFCLYSATPPLHLAWPSHQLTPSSWATLQSSPATSHEATPIQQGPAWRPWGPGSPTSFLRLVWCSPALLLSSQKVPRQGLLQAMWQPATWLPSWPPGGHRTNRIRSQSCALCPLCSGLGPQVTTVSRIIASMVPRKQAGDRVGCCSPATAGPV